MSTINTNGIDVNYPIPGQNNSSQGFRNNFAAIKNNLNIASDELSDLQAKAVLKAALDNTTLNNDMANTLISNAATLGFRHTTYNLGNSLSGTVLVDVSLGDVQYGTVSGNVTLQFGSWAPVGTQSNVQLELSVSNSQAVITFPSEVVFTNDNYGVTTLENYANSANTPTVTVPYGVSQLNYRLSTLDCGNTIIIEPYNRPRITTQIQQRTPSPVGFQGDVAGTVAIDADYLYVCTEDYSANTYVKTGANSIYGNVTNHLVASGTASSITGTVLTVGGTVTGTFLVGMYLTGTGVTAGTYITSLGTGSGGVGTYNISTSQSVVSTTITGTADFINLNNTTSLTVDDPIIFTGDAFTSNVFGNLSANTIYYIKTLNTPVSGIITVSDTRTAGTAGNVVTLTTENYANSNVSITAVAYVGTDIWKRISLTSW